MVQINCECRDSISISESSLELNCYQDPFIHIELYDNGGVQVNGIPDRDIKPGNDVIQLKLFISAVLPFLLVPFSSARADETRALNRLMNITSALQDIGDEMIGEPVTGTVVRGDTTSLQLTFSNEYMYSVYVWSDSYFNTFEFWLTDSGGDIQSITKGDYASLVAIPDTTGNWTLSILLFEGAFSDSASYAAAVFRIKRYI